MTATIVTVAEPTAQDRHAVLAPLVEHNELRAGPANPIPVAILVKDGQGATIGGLWGRSTYDWLFVEYLALPEDYRGQGLGTAPMLEAERLARVRGCRGLWLDTFDSQARGFYEKLGFTVFGTIEDHPVGGRRHFMSKHLAG